MSAGLTDAEPARRLTDVRWGGTGTVAARADGS
jgi:hypothetical protein